MHRGIDFPRKHTRSLLLSPIVFLFLSILVATEIHAGEIPPEEPRLKWVLGNVDATSTQKISPVAGPDGTVYFGSPDNGLSAVRPDGTLKWKREGLRSDTAPAVSADGTVYYGSYPCLYAFSSDGSLKWNVRVNIGTYSSPAIGYRGDVYIGSEDGFLYAFTPQGELRWRHQTGQTKASPIVGSDGTVYVASTDGNIYAVTPWGTRKWAFGGIHGWAYTAPALGPDGTLYYWSVNNYLYAINLDGTLKWKSSIREPLYSSPAVAADGTIYLGSYRPENGVCAVNPDGSLKWTFQTGSHVSSSPAIGSDGTVYIGCDNSYVFALNPDGSPKWKYQTSSAADTGPAISPDGTVYVGAKFLYAFQTDSYGYQPGSPWPGFSYPSRSMLDPGRVVEPELHTVRGQVAMPDSTPLIDVDVTVEGLTVSTDSYGYYSFDLPDGTYTITFDVHSSVIPGSVRVAVSGSDVWVDPYEPEKHPVRGRLFVRGGPLPGMRVFAAGQTATTDEEGWYSLLLPDGKYTLAIDVGEDYFPGSKDIEVNGAGVTVEAVYLNRILWRYTATGSVYSPSPSPGPDGCSYLLVRMKGVVQLQEVGPDGAPRRYYEIDSPNPLLFTRGIDGTFYIPNGDEMIAVNPDLTLKWKYTITEGGISREPAVGPDGAIYFGCVGKMVYALNPDGTFRWKYPFSDRMEIVPAIGSDGTVYVPGCDGKLYAFQPDGVLKWTYVAGGPIYSTPQFGPDGVLYFGARDSFFHAVNPDGTLKWKFYAGSAIMTDAELGTDGAIHVVNEDGELLVLNPGGTLRWKLSGPDHYSRIWIYPPTGEIWVWLLSSEGSDIAALKPTGEMKWRERTTMSFPVCGADGKIRVTGYSDTNPRAGYLWEVEMGEHDPHPVAVESEGTVRDNRKQSASGLLSLHQNRPNPFNPSTAIQLSLNVRERVVIDIFNISGQHVTRLADTFLTAGPHQVVWDGSGCAAGIYLVRVVAGNEVRTCKMLLAK